MAIVVWFRNAVLCIDLTLLLLQLHKIEDGLLNGTTLYHRFIKKTAKEKLELEKKKKSKL